ncbi:MAG: hypothetical protein IKM46_01575 [Clostridia bacterium]|nr:hypothetical protein [Clostridia bacterium]
MGEIIYKAADTKWDLRSGFGNHRFTVRAETGEYVKATLHWRRRDPSPWDTGLRIRYGDRLDGVGREEVSDVFVLSCTRDVGVVVFRAPVTGEYEIYYMPFVMPGDWYAPCVEYMRREDMKPCAAWKAGFAEEHSADAVVIAYESRTEFDSFYPMEMPMAEEEKVIFLGESPFCAVAESRLLPVRMKCELPFIWLDRQDRLTLSDTVFANEHYVFQVALCAKENLDNVRIRFSDESGKEYSCDEVVCFNLYGVDADGVEMNIRRDVKRGEVLPLWCGVRCEELTADECLIFADVTADNTGHTERIFVKLTRLPHEIIRNGDDELWRLSRLFWLNDTIGISNDVIAPYTPVLVNEEAGVVSVLGRKFTLGELGLPSSILSYFNDFCLIDNTEPIELLKAPIHLEISENGMILTPAVTEKSLKHDGTVQSRVITDAVCGSLELTSEVTYEADGHIDCRLRLCARADGEYEFALRLPMDLRAVRYMMGMCREGGEIPSKYIYRWDESFDGNEVWVGSPRVGLQLKLMQENEAWHGAKPLPRLWGNGGLGQLKLIRRDTEGEVLLEALTGAVKLRGGQSEVLHFHLIVTPFHEIDCKHHFTHHYYHKNPWNSSEHIPSLERAKEMGTHTVILHQGSPLNENINYPFILADKIKAEVDRAHEMGLRYKLYYTVRELSNYTSELWALISLGDEVFPIDGEFRIADYFMKSEDKTRERPDGGAWLVEHHVNGFTPAWHQFLENGEFDCAIRTQAKSRWHNYYLKGLDWLIRVVGIDGIYLDGIGYDRHIMRRVRRVMEEAKPGVCDIDIHCGNEHNPIYGNGISACIYLEHFAYADSIWNGEGFDCQNSSPDNFFTEMCGIPFGLMGEMLEGGGNAFRGMLYGMSARCGWSQGGVSTTLWSSVWDTFGIGDAKMYGYWHPECPVAVDNDQVKATVYVKENGDVLICLASWFPFTRSFRLSIDLDALGITGDYELYAPKIENMRPTDRRLPLEGVDMSSPVGNLQEERVFGSDEAIPICPHGGWMLFLIRK